ncbi:First ORF in transposon ISC1904 [Desulfurococcaceae archaeon AG1]|nr:First ORF in transposon ISC1904 [Desulfurococcaceae archaeon AG1]
MKIYYRIERAKSCQLVAIDFEGRSTIELKGKLYGMRSHKYEKVRRSTIELKELILIRGLIATNNQEDLL